MQRLMYATLKLGILENSRLYNTYCKNFDDAYSANVLVNARSELAKRIENMDGLVDLALIEAQFEAGFIRDLPKQIEYRKFPDPETAITTVATLYAALKYFDNVVEGAILIILIRCLQKRNGLCMAE